MTLATFNKLGLIELFAALQKCCGATEWINLMMQDHPFKTQQEVFDQAIEHWNFSCKKEDWLEAFDHHPKIGNLKNLEKKFAATKNWSGEEQAAVKQANAATLQALADGNKAYEKKFGYIFIVCATGKSASEMLTLLERRIDNKPSKEIKIAVREQEQITQLRLEKLLQE